MKSLFIADFGILASLKQHSLMHCSLLRRHTTLLWYFLKEKIQEAGDFNKNPNFLQFNLISALSLSRVLFVQGFLVHNFFVNWHDASGCFHLDVSNCLMTLGAG